LDNNFSTYVAAFLTRLTGYEGRYNYLGTRKLIKTIKTFKPDIVQLYSLHGFYINSFKLLSYLKKHQIKVVYSMIDEYPYMGKCCYSYDCLKFQTECSQCPMKKDYPESWFFDRSKEIFYRKKNIYTDFKSIVFTGPGWVCGRAKTSAIMKEQRIEELDEPINYEEMFYPRDTQQLKKDLNIPDENRIILTVADMRYERKGGKYFLQVAEKLVNKKDLTFVFIGFRETMITTPQNVITIAFVKSQDLLAEYYSMADLFVCTSLADTMPNVCLDALGCGTPLCGFAEAGTSFTASPEYGTFTPTYDIDALARVIEGTPKKNIQRSQACMSYARSRFSTEVVFDKLMSIYKSL
jgi:glycosyltransferase involved in cell wall biosynthesis